MIQVMGPTSIALPVREPDPYPDIPLRVNGQPETRVQKAKRLRRESEMRTPQEWMNEIVERKAKAKAAAKFAAEQQRALDEQAERERLNDPFYIELQHVADLGLSEDVWQEVATWQKAVDEEKAKRQELRLRNKRAIDALKADARAKHRKRDKEYRKRKTANENREKIGE